LSLTVQAQKKKVEDPRKWLEEGDLYFSQYEFEKSAAAYTKYSDRLTKDKKSTDSIAPLIELSERAARMLSRCEDIQLIDSVIVDKKDFLNAYHISGESGHLENQNGRIIFENPLKDKRYFSEKKGSSGARLYSEIKLQKEWTDKQELAIPTDSLSDDAYPFVLPDGLTIYYASTGKGSIGGYDLFVTRYNLNNDTWLAPNQMGMPFNSTANDYMMAIDEQNNIGYFATDRFQPEGKVIIYTFIPNEEVTQIETDNNQELIDRAKITAIKNSWKPNVNYKNKLAQVRKAIQDERTKAVKDFSFVINDQAVYSTLNDFKNDAAKQAFLKATELQKTIAGLEQELDALRLEYTQASNAKKQSMRSGILSKETQLESLQTQYKQFIKNVRNFELK
jgi:hypothetical protein